MISEYYNSYKELGLIPIGIEWDAKNKQPISHRFWSDTHDLKLLPKHNGLMVKTEGQWACLDFDIKNTERKTLFKEWQTIVINQWPDLYDKLYIEKTRSEGYHAWLRYPKLEKKLSLADSAKGSEVIALYAKGPLVYTFPTPGYTEFSGSMQDVQELTDKEFDYIISTSQVFNEYKPEYNPDLKAVKYPEGSESLLSQFDAKLPDEFWETILSEIGLKPISGYKYGNKDKFTAYRRTGSESPGISAKVYYRNKRLMIFSASMHDFPNWHNKHDYPVWSLPPSFVLFYKFKRNWPATIEYINSIIESIGLEIEVEQKINTNYPLHVFPESIRRSIIDVSHARSLAPQFVATAGLWTASSLAGSRYISDFKQEGKNILFCLLIAPVSAGKTPAFKVMCDTPLYQANIAQDKRYLELMDEYEEKKNAQASGKKTELLKRPVRYIPISTDGTTEGYIHKSMIQKCGIGVYMDEAETIFNAGGFKSNNDAISFFTQAFSGGRTTQIRADDSKERVVPNLNLNILMGTQPTRVKNIFTEDRLSSGFASRFLMVESDYMELNTEVDPFGSKKEMCQEWVDIVCHLFHEGLEYNNGGGQQVKISITDEAKDIYRAYYRQILIEANGRFKSKAESYIIGTEAKMSAYLPRLIQVLSIIHNPSTPVITSDIVKWGWDLYKYYAQATVKVIASLHNEIETGLPKDLEVLYQALPDEFTRKEATDACTRININERRFDVSIRRKDFAALFVKLGHGKYRKV